MNRCRRGRSRAARCRSAWSRRLRESGRRTSTARLRSRGRRRPGGGCRRVRARTRRRSRRRSRGATDGRTRRDVRCVPNTELDRLRLHMPRRACRRRSRCARAPGPATGPVSSASPTGVRCAVARRPSTARPYRPRRRRTRGRRGSRSRVRCRGHGWGRDARRSCDRRVGDSRSHPSTTPRRPR